MGKAAKNMHQAFTEEKVRKVQRNEKGTDDKQVPERQSRCDWTTYNAYFFNAR